MERTHKSPKYIVNHLYMVNVYNSLLNKKGLEKEAIDELVLHKKPLTLGWWSKYLTLEEQSLYLIKESQEVEIVAKRDALVQLNKMSNSLKDIQFNEEDIGL